MDDQQFDYIAVLLMVVMILWFTVLRLRNPQKYSLKNPIKTVVIGILALILLTLNNSSQEHRSDIGYILSFLCLKKVSAYHQGYYIRGMVSLSYVGIFVGALQLLLARKSNLKKDTTDGQGS